MSHGSHMGLYYSLYYPAYFFTRYEDVTFAYSTEIFGIIKIKTKCKQWQETVLVPNVFQQCFQHCFPFIKKQGS